MISNYQVKYSETEEVIQDICRVNAAEKVAWNHRITVAVVGLVSGIVILMKGNVLDNPPAEIAVKVGIYLVLWVLAFIVGEILAKTLGMKSALSSANIEGTDAYKQRIRKWGKPLEVKVEFYDEYFTTWAKGLQMKKIQYNEVIKLLESKDTIAIMGQVAGDPHKRIYAFPKTGIVDATTEEFTAFLEEKCTYVPKGIKKVEYVYKKKEKK